MPALFAYLVALGLLLGGGYGAMNWLAAPAPVSAAAKARPKAVLPSPQLRPEETSEASLSATASDTIAAVEPSSSAKAGNNDSSSTERPALPAETSVATVEPAVQPASVSPAPKDQVRMAHAEVSSDDAMPSERIAARAVKAADSVSGSTATAASSAARPAKRSHRRQAANRPEKRKLVLMTLRTIQFADGRRATQLVPYRSRERVLAFGPDE